LCSTTTRSACSNSRWLRISQRLGADGADKRSAVSVRLRRRTVASWSELLRCGGPVEGTAVLAVAVADQTADTALAEVETAGFRAGWVTPSVESSVSQGAASSAWCDDALARPRESLNVSVPFRRRYVTEVA
jgi:hypothetical protein